MLLSFSPYENTCLGISAVLALAACIAYYFLVVKPVKDEQNEDHKSWLDEMSAKNSGMVTGANGNGVVDNYLEKQFEKPKE